MRDRAGTMMVVGCVLAAGIAAGAEADADHQAVSPEPVVYTLDMPLLVTLAADPPVVVATEVVPPPRYDPRQPADRPLLRTTPPPSGHTADDFFDFNVGLGAVVLTDRDDGRVESAAVRKGKIRVEKSDQVRLGVLVEAHRMFRVFDDDDRFGHGPYAGLIVGQEDVIDAFSIGWMGAMRRGDSSQSFNLMVGVFLDPNAKMLADDFQEGDTFKTDGQVQYKEEPMWGWLLGASFGF